jgi:cytosine deaminase
VHEVLPHTAYRRRSPPAFGVPRQSRKGLGATTAPDKEISPSWFGDWKATTCQPNLRDLRWRLAIDAPDAEVVDVSGRLVRPGLVEAHCHLDKTLYGRAWEPHSAGDALADRIGNERRRCGRLDGRVTVEQVAFPQSGMLANPGTAELLEEALELGVATIGGIDPAGMDRDPVGHLDVVFGLAERYGTGIDIHLHDGGTLGAFELELIIERTRAAGLGGKVTVSHAYALGQIDPAYQDRLAAGLAEAGVTVTTAAVFDFPVPPIKRLRAAGVNVACGHDDIRDLWSPYGTGDMLERAMHVAYRSTFRRDEDIEIALEAATYGGARALGLPSYGLAAGAPADLVVLAADTPAAAVVTRPVRDLVLKAGRIVARDGRLT